MAHPDKTCGGCTLCCKLVSVEELQKPATRCCDHQIPGTGCGIYGERPLSCQLYQCTWLKVPARWMGEALRPDRCHVVLEETQQGWMARCDPDYPDAWCKGAVASLLSLHAKNGNPVYVMCGKQMFVVGAEGAIAIPKRWVVDSNDGMRQHFTVPNAVLRKVGWGPFKFLDKMRRKCN